jgi:hypothetical protein
MAVGRIENILNSRPISFSTTTPVHTPHLPNFTTCNYAKPYNYSTKISHPEVINYKLVRMRYHLRSKQNETSNISIKKLREI